jgi:hypothetical protein
MFPEITYNPNTGNLEWADSPSAMEYQIEWDEVDGNDWKILYTGPNNYCSYDKKGDTKTRGKEKENETWGPFGPPNIIHIP